jgi:hypothetical protein
MLFGHCERKDSLFPAIDIVFSAKSLFFVSADTSSVALSQKICPCGDIGLPQGLPILCVPPSLLLQRLLTSVVWAGLAPAHTTAGFMRTVHFFLYDIHVIRKKMSNFAPQNKKLHRT